MILFDQLQIFLVTDPSFSIGMATAQAINALGGTVICAAREAY